MLRVQKKLDVTAERAPTRTAEVSGKLSHIGKRPNTEKYFKVMVPCDRNDREQREKCLEKERIIFFLSAGWRQPRRCATHRSHTPVKTEHIKQQQPGPK